jgi:hypothetical protein
MDTGNNSNVSAVERDVFTDSEATKERAARKKGAALERGKAAWLDAAKSFASYGMYSLPTFSFMLMAFAIHNVAVFVGSQTYFIMAGFGLWFGAFMASAIRELKTEKPIKPFDAFFWVTAIGVITLNYPVSSFIFLFAGSSSNPKELVMIFGYLFMAIVPTGIFLGRIYGHAINVHKTDPYERLEWCITRAAKAAIAGGLISMLLINAGGVYQSIHKISLLGLYACCMCIILDRSQWLLKIIKVLALLGAIGLVQKATTGILLADVGDSAYDAIGTKDGSHVVINKSHRTMMTYDRIDVGAMGVAEMLNADIRDNANIVLHGESFWQIKSPAPQRTFFLAEQAEFTPLLATLGRVSPTNVYFTSILGIPSRITSPIDWLAIDLRIGLSSHPENSESEEFFIRMSKSLNPNGVLVMLMGGDADFSETMLNKGKQYFQACSLKLLPENNQIVRCNNAKLKA